MAVLDQLSSQLTIDALAIRKNVMAFAPCGRMMAIVKANGYATGVLPLVHLLEDFGVNMFGLAYVDEAIELREAGIASDLFVLYATPDEADRVANYDLHVAVSDTHLVDALAATGKRVRVHIHMDTGMVRLGCRDVAALAAHIARQRTVELTGIMSHFPAAENPDHDLFSQQQIQRFLEAALPLDLPWRHIAATDGAARFTIPECNMVRIGLGLFGCHNSIASKRALPLSPALSLTSYIATCHNPSPQTSVGYGRRYWSQGHTVGVIPLGFYDGIPFHMHHLWVDGSLAPIAGPICMDFCMVEAPDLQVGDRVEVFGPNRSVEALAADVGVNCCKIISGIGPRIRRCFTTQ